MYYPAPVRLPCCAEEDGRSAWLDATWDENGRKLSFSNHRPQHTEYVTVSTPDPDGEERVKKRTTWNVPVAVLERKVKWKKKTLAKEPRQTTWSENSLTDDVIKGERLLCMC